MDRRSLCYGLKGLNLDRLSNFQRPSVWVHPVHFNHATRLRPHIHTNTYISTVCPSASRLRLNSQVPPRQANCLTEKPAKVGFCSRKIAPQCDSVSPSTAQTVGHHSHSSWSIRSKAQHWNAGKHSLNPPFITLANGISLRLRRTYRHSDFTNNIEARLGCGALI
ncbi:unnamed protein product [Protopolystoma xenopodis]|uniref:Uncharacterized protein n=1 Tax=Protopolystoma xenopodis TaxID=117903 RepID=A0A448WJF4_9PLAT|nr:unnamed protein product [Protopolystoma xenopodis]